MASPAAVKVFKNFINGEWVESRSGKSIENRNPANTGELVGMIPASNDEDVSIAIDAAKAAYALDQIDLARADLLRVEESP